VQVGITHENFRFWSKKRYGSFPGQRHKLIYPKTLKSAT